MSIRYCGRDFNEDEIAQINRLIAEDSSRHRAELSRLTCRALAWLKADGSPKDMSARVAMLRMHEDGLIQLPPAQRKKPDTTVRITARTDPQMTVTTPGPSLAPLDLYCLKKGDSRSGLWNEHIQRYNYLSHKHLPGAQLRYIIYAKQQPIALLGASPNICELGYLLPCFGDDYWV